MKRFARVGLAVAAITALLVLAVHTPPFRRLVLRYAIAEVQRRYAIQIQADRLDYNLAALSFGLLNVRIAAVATPQAPFFSSNYIHVTLPRRALTGIVAFDEIAVTGGHIRIVRDADGHLNLPPSSGATPGEPAALDVARLSAPGLAVDVQDAPDAITLSMPSLNVDVGRTSGRVSLGVPANLAKGNTRGRIDLLDGGATFDGRALKFAALRLRADELATQVDGALSLLVPDPSLDVRLTGTADVEKLARWVPAFAEASTGKAPPSVPHVVVAFNGHVAGTLAAPSVDANLDFPIAAGRVHASGTVPSGDAPAHLTATWSDIDAAALTFELAQKVSIAPTATLSGNVTASGPLADLSRWSADLKLHAEGGVTRRGRVAIPGDTHLTLADGRWHADARHRIGGTAPVALTAEGQLDERDLARSTINGHAVIEDARVASLLSLARATGVANVANNAVAGGTVRATVALSGRFAAPRIDADVTARDLAGEQFRVPAAHVTVAGNPATPVLSFNLRTDTAVIAGQPLADAQATGRLDRSLLTIERVSVSQAAQLGMLSLAGTYNLDSQTYDATADVRRWSVVATADLPLAASINADFRASGTLQAPRGSGSLTVGNTTWRGASLGDITADLQLDGQSATLTGRAPALNTTLDARTTVRAPYAAVGDLRVDRLDLAHVIPADTPVAMTGTLSLNAHAEGPLKNWHDATAHIDVTSLDAHAGDLPIRLTTPAQLDFRQQQLRIDRLEALAGETRISASGELPGRGVRLAVDGDIGEAVRAASATGLATTLPIAEASGPLTLRALVSGTLDMPTVTGDLTAGPGSIAVKGLSTATDVQLQAHLDRDAITLGRAHMAYEGAMLDATGSIPLAFLESPKPSGRTVPASLHATLTGITPSVLRGVVDPASLDDLAGAVDVALNLESPSTDPSGVTGDLTLTRLDLQMAGLPVTQRTPTRIVAKDGFARIESWNWQGEGATLGVFGQVRLTDRLAAIIANGDIDLRVLTPFVRSAGLTTAGRLTPKISVTGPIDAPRVDGDIALESGEVRLVDPRIVVDGLSGRASLTRTTATLRTLTGSINGGSLTGGGTIEYQSGSGLSAQLTADVRDMALDFPQGLRSDLNAMLRLDTASAPDGEPPSGTLSGTITLVRGAYREPLAVVGGLLDALRARSQSAAVAAEQAPQFLDRLALDVRLQTDEDLIVDNNYARVQLGADLDLIGTAAAPAMSGRATFRDGGQLFVGRNTYTVTSDKPSTIDFVSANAIAPELNVHVTTHVAGEDIDLDLTGPAESPQVAMSSTNGDSEADITALLLTGRKLDELATADASFIGTQVIGNLSGEVLGFAGRAIGLDTLRLGGVEDTGIRQDPNAIASEVDPTSRLTFSKALGSKIDLTFSQSLRDATAQTWIVDYLPARQLDVRVVNGDTNLRTYRLRHDISFGGARATLPRVASAARPREPRVTDVVISGNLIAPEQRLRSLLKLRAGDTFDFGRWQDDRDRIEDFYHHSDRLTARVAASRMANGDEVKLAYMIDAGPQTSILVSGIDLSREEVARLADVWSTSIFDGFLVDEATQIVKGDLATRGYLQPTVMARVETTADMKTLRVDIQPGARTTETRISVQVDDTSLAADLDAHIGERHLATQVVADPNAVTSDITAYLRARGYLRAVVTAGAPRFDQGTTTVPVIVQAGPLFTIASVAFEGRQGVPANDLASVAAIAAGMPYDPGAIDGARRRLLTLYRGRGFATADVESRADVVAESQRVSVTFVVRESAQQTIGDIIVSGNGGVNSDVVTRALGLMVGAPLEPAELVRARARVFSTGLFRRVDVTTEMMARTGPADAPQPMRVRVDVEAWPALRLQYGFQVAEVHPESDPTGLSLQPGLSAEATRRTLFGRDLTLGGVVEVERWQNTVRGLVSAPTLFAIPLQSQLVVERVREQSQATPFSTARSSVAWQQLLKRASHLSLSYSYRFDEDHTFDNIPDPGTGLNFDIRIRIARLIGAAAWDTRNDPLNAVRGSLMSSTIEWAPDRLGSQFRFLKYIGQAYRFQNVHGVVLASAARLGLAQPLGGQELILSERFFAGGSRTVRGVGEGALGRRDIFGDPAGGESMLVLNQEARFPIHKWLGGVAFIDAGNVYPQPTAIRLNEITGSIGFGFRLSTPFALLRADYGRIMWQGATEPPPGSTLRPGQWTFGIGQAF